MPTTDAAMLVVSESGDICRRKRARHHRARRHRQIGTESLTHADKGHAYGWRKW